MEDLLKTLLTFVPSIIWRALVFLGSWVRRQAFASFDRLYPTMDKVIAREHAFAVLGGSIMKAIPFRNLGVPHKFIAVLRSPSDKDLICRIHILEQMAENYREIWQSGDLWGCKQDEKIFSVADIDGDGTKEILFESSSFGSGAGCETLCAYSPKTRKVYTLELDYDWNAPAWPDLKLHQEPHHPDAVDRPLLEGLVRHARKANFIRPLETIDLDDPRNAVIRWHKENGDLEYGEVSIHAYEGPPSYGATPTAELLDGDITWTGYFKGPVYGYDTVLNTHFVVYSPANRYHWPISFYADRQFLWIGTRGSGIIRYDKLSKLLKKLQVIANGKEVDEIESIERKGRDFLVNARIRVREWAMFG